MKAKLLLLIAVAILIAGAAAAYKYWGNNHSSSDDRIRVSGNIEATETQVAFKIAGRVESREVDEGVMVAAGRPIARLETADLELNVALRQAELKAAEAVLAKLTAGSRIEEIEAAKSAWQQAAHALADLEAGSRPQEIAAAEAALAATKAERDRWQSDLVRATALYNRKTISTEDYDRVRTGFDMADQRYREAEEKLKLIKEGPRHEQIEQARAALARAKAQYDLVLAGPRKEDRDQAEAIVEKAQAALRLAETQLGYASIVSPLSGMVLSKNIEPGEYVAPGTPVVTIGDLVNVWLRAYIEEPDLDRVKLGQKATVSIDSGKTFQGRVSFIADEAEFTPKNVQTQKERVKLVYRIKIDIHNPEMA
ncbi:MAG: HlyD family efflux transporter periplasmic adaptor subunit, partial [Pirellulaceae bacterium]|nr:HlyD family efflux transporter periplasmic adaptor subunit [Pirellulaceae bacterium]